MNNIHLKTVLKKYEQKRISAGRDLETRKNALYAENKRLEEIDFELGNEAITTAKLILSSKTSSLKDFVVKKNALNKEKTAILKSLGKDSAFLSPIFECIVCKDTGYIGTSSTSTFCNCLKQEMFNLEFNKYNMGNLEKENFDSFNAKFYSDKADEKKYNSDISPRENMLSIKEVAKNFIENFDSPEEKNLLFWGKPGLGKTFLCNCIANELLNKHKTVLYQTAPVMLDEVIASRMGKPDSNQNILKNILNADLLIIDDLGTENVNSMKFTELFNIINTRLLNQNRKVTKTIISTNLSLQQIFSTYDERIGSRIIGHYLVCGFFGDDIRLKKI
ncbi:MAG: ATP-binding protein [Oscillospiraceae bacterium]|nr:ATP-binding protein [Oscillospiraceae bacterium]